MRVPSREELEQKAELLKKNIKSLQEIIDANIGQQVLVIETSERLMGGTGPGEKVQVSRQTTLKLGMPSDYSIAELGRGWLAIPMKHYLLMQDSYGRNNWEKIQKPITIDVLGIANLNNEVPYRSFETVNIEDLKSGLEVIAGDLDVAAYFTIGHELLPSQYKLVQKEHQQGKLTDEQLKQRISASRDFDVNYILAVKELGTKLLPELHKPVQNYKEGIVSALYHHTPNPKEYLKAALKLDMHKDPLTLEFKEDGVTIDVPVFIRKKCKYNEVKIPE